MEERNSIIKRIVLTGPECSGKTTLSKQLSEYYNEPWLPEFAREYVENLNRPYNFNDVVYIAKKQIELENNYMAKAKKFLILDTDLIITKIWLLHVYGKCPEWINNEIKKNENSIYLLCMPDLPWQPDNVRENPNIREELLNKYKNEIIKNNFSYFVISNSGEERFKNTINNLNNIL